jgi:CRP-like cAMP-binding protein
MNNPNICDLIQHSSLTSDLSEAQCSDLSSVAAARSLDDKEVLIEQGQIDETLHIVSSGALTVERVTAGGETVTLHILRPGDLAGEMGFVDGTGHTATLRAMGPTSVELSNYITKAHGRY